MSKTHAIMLVLTSACLLAVSMNIAKAVISRVPLYVLLMTRSIGALALLVPFTVAAVLMGYGVEHRAEWWLVAVIGLGGVIWPGVVNVLAYRALRVLPVNVNRPIFQMFPVIAFMLSIPLGLGEFTWLNMAGVLLATAGGMGFGFFNKSAGGGGKRLPRAAIGLVVLSAVIHATGSLLWKWVRDRDIISPYEMNMWQHVAAVVFFGTLVYMTRKPVEQREEKTYTRKDLLLVGFSGLMLFGIGNTLYFVALKYLDPGPAGAIYSINILLTAGLARITLRERWTVAQAVSALLVLAGVSMLALFR